jgi:hypothetical protein
MSVIVETGVIRLVGRCLPEDAEPLLAALADHSDFAIDVAAAQKLHLCVVQVLLAAGRSVLGAADNPVLARYLVDLLP